MFFNLRSLLKLALATAFLMEASAIDLEPWGTDHHPGVGSGHAIKRDPSPLKLGATGRPNDSHTRNDAREAPPPVELRAISDPGVLLRGRSEKREMSGNGCFDPAKHSTFFWGVYGASLQ